MPSAQLHLSVEVIEEFAVLMAVWCFAWVCSGVYSARSGEQTRASAGEWFCASLAGS